MNNAKNHKWGPKRKNQRIMKNEDYQYLAGEHLEEGEQVAEKLVDAPTTKESLENFVEMGLDIDNGTDFARDISLSEFELTKSPVKPLKKTEDVTEDVRNVPVAGHERLPASKCQVILASDWSILIM